MLSIFNEAKLFLKSNKSVLVIINIIISFFAFLSILLLSNLEISGDQKIVFENIRSNNKKYRIVDDGVDVSKYYRSLSEFTNLKNFYNSLSHNDKFDYYELIQQPLNIETSAEDKDIFIKFSPDYEYGEISDLVTIGDKKYLTVKNFFVGMNYYNELNFNIAEGRGFNESDIVLKDMNESIPAIMGYEYMQIFNVGDTINVNHLDCNLKLCIIGFLEENSYMPLSSQDSFININRYMLLPSINFSFSPTTSEELFFQGAFYLQKINGYIVLNNCNINEAMRYIDNAKLSNGLLFDFLLVKENNVNISIIESLIYTSYAESLFIMCVVEIFCVYVIIKMSNYIVERKKLFFKLMNIFGYSRSKIIFIKIMLLFYLTLPSFLLTLSILLLLGFNLVYCILFYFIMEVAVIILLFIRERKYTI